MSSWIQRLKHVPEGSVPKWQKGLEAARAANKHKPFCGTTTSLSPSELKTFKACDSEACKICGKQIVFNTFMPRADYQYKQKKKGGTCYYCGWNHYRQDGGGK